MLLIEISTCSFYIQIDIDKKLGYNQEKDWSISLRKQDWEKVQLSFQRVAIENEKRFLAI